MRIEIEMLRKLLTFEEELVEPNLGWISQEKLGLANPSYHRQNISKSQIRIIDFVYLIERNSVFFTRVSSFQEKSISYRFNETLDKLLVELYCAVPTYRDRDSV